MSYRFTTPEKWQDVWFRKLSISEKLIFLFFLDNCNLAGFIELDFESISFFTGLSEIEILTAVKGLNKGCLTIDNWVWLKNFLKHQKNLPLNPENNAHKHIIGLIKEQVSRFDISEDFRNFYIANLGAKEGLISPPGKGNSKGNSKGNKIMSEEIPTFDEFFAYAKTIEIYSPDLDFQIKTKYDSWKQNNWKDGNNNPILVWKNKIRSTMPFFKRGNVLTTPPTLQLNKTGAR